RGVVRGDEDVDVFHRLAAPADGSGDFDAVHAAVRVQDLHDLRGDRACQVEGRACPTRPPRGDTLEDVVARLLPDATDAEDRPGAAGLFQPLDGVDGESLVQDARGLRAEAAELEQGGERRWQLATQRVEIGHP